MAWRPFLLVVALGCRGPRPTPDVDGDGIPASSDCDDHDAGVAAAGSWYADADGDGLGAGSAVEACATPPRHVASAGDCDDADPAVLGEALLYIDADGDGLAGSSTRLACPGGGLGAEPTDCDDADPTQPATTYADADADGFGEDGTAEATCADPNRASIGGDCDDTDAYTWPGAPERCGDGSDNDCDGSVAACRYEGWYELGHVGTIIEGVDPRGTLSAGLAVVGDLDGNGTDDVAASAWRAATNADYAGALYFVTDPTQALVDRASVARVTGTDTYQGVGQMVRRVGDQDGDGVEDVGVTDSAPGTSRVRVLSGLVRGDGTIDDASPLGTLPITLGPSDFGGGEDWTGDGRDDLLVSVHTDSDEYGVVWLYEGPANADSEPWATLTGASDADRIGRGLDRVSDVDGDGVDEFVVHAMPQASTPPHAAGILYLVTSPVAGATLIADQSHATIRGSVEEEAFGQHVGSGDVNGDGYADLVVSSLALHMDGIDQDVGARLLVGPISGEHGADDVAAAVFYDEDSCCEVVEIPGDVDGDGFDDILIATPAAPHPNLDGRSGAVHLFYGAPELVGSRNVWEHPGRTDADAVFYGIPGDVSGEILDGGDLDGDGYADFVVSAADHITDDYLTGAVYVVFGQRW